MFYCLYSFQSNLPLRMCEHMYHVAQTESPCFHNFQLLEPIIRDTLEGFLAQPITPLTQEGIFKRKILCLAIGRKDYVARR